MRILVTGAGGFAGSHLIEHLLSVAQPDAELHGVIWHSTGRVEPLLAHFTAHRLDLCDQVSVEALIQDLQPQQIFHLAAQSNSVLSFQQPWLTHEQNVRSQLNLLEAVKRWQPAARCLIVSSNEVYGPVSPEQLPITESCPYAPVTPYGVSKATQELLALQCWRHAQIHTVIARSFNHIGPRQTADFVASAFARQLVEIEMGTRAPILVVGNLDAERDFTDVRDIVAAYWLLLNQSAGGQIYNVASGVAVSIQRLLDILLNAVTIPVEVISRPNSRPSDAPCLVADITSLQHATGWRPTYTLEQTLHDIMNYWRQTLAAPSAPRETQP